MLRTWKEVILYLWECIFEFVRRHRDQSNSATKLRLMSGRCTWMDWKYCDQMLFRCGKLSTYWFKIFYELFPEIYTFVPWNQSLVLTIMISPVRITLRHFYSSTLCERESTWIKCGLHSWMAGGGTFRRRAQVPSLHAANLSLDIVDKLPLRVTFWFLQGNIGAFSLLYLAGPHPPGWYTQDIYVYFAF